MGDLILGDIPVALVGAKELINLATLVCVWQFADAMGGMLPHASVTGTLCKLLSVECCNM